MTVGTQCIKASLILAGAEFTGVTPAFSRHLAAAALCLGGVQSFGYGAFSSLESCEAETLPRVKAAATVIRQNETGLTDTLEAPRGVNAGAKLTDVGFNLTVINVNTLVVLHSVAWGTDAAEGAHQILTGTRRAGARERHTLVYICTVLIIRGELVALLAQALEGAQAVDALTMPADLTGQCSALIHIHAVVVVRKLKAREAQAVIRAHCVLTCTVTTRLPLTLINIHAHGLVGCGLEAVVAQTAVAALHVDTVSMAAHVGLFLTFITIHAGSAEGQLEAG